MAAAARLLWLSLDLPRGRRTYRALWLAGLRHTPTLRSSDIHRHRHLVQSRDRRRRLRRAAPDPGEGGNQVQATASLLPGTKYRATISTALLSTNGGALPAPLTWSFTTRPIVHFPLATGPASSVTWPWRRIRRAASTLSMPTRSTATSSTPNAPPTCAFAASWISRGDAGPWATSALPARSASTHRAGSTSCFGVTGFRAFSTRPASRRAPTCSPGPSPRRTTRAA